eukprot:247649-Pleurochrysis_carterae.AAC.3
MRCCDDGRAVCETGSLAQRHAPALSTCGDLHAGLAQSRSSIDQVPIEAIRPLCRSRPPAGCA